MKIIHDLRLCRRISWLTLVLGILATPAAARADLLVNDLSDKMVPAGVVPQYPARLSPATAFCPLGPATREPAVQREPGVLLALLGVCIHPPVNPPDPVSTATVISGTSGSKPPTGPHTTSVSPEPDGLMIGLIGAGVAGLAAMRYQWRLPRVA